MWATEQPIPSFLQETFEPRGIIFNMEMKAWGLLELAWGPPKGRAEIKVQGSPWPCSWYVLTLMHPSVNVF